MKIGQLEIRIMRQLRSILPHGDGIDRTGALAVPDTEAWWLAVHQIIDEAELETMQAARDAHRTANTNATIGAVGASEGCDLIRRKLNDARKAALMRAR